MSERISYNQEYQPAPTNFEDGTELDFRASQLGSAEQGRLQAEAARLAEAASPEQPAISEHEVQIGYVSAIGRHTIAMRQLELSASEAA